MKKQEEKRWSGVRRLSGSYTVEASLIFSVLLLILVYVLTTTEYLTDSVRMTAVLAEQASSLTSNRGEELPEVGHFFHLHGESIRRETGGKNVMVSCREGISGIPFGKEYQGTFTAERRDPVTWLRRIRLLQALSE